MMLGVTIELHMLRLSLRSGVLGVCRSKLGIDGDANVIFVSTYRGVFMVHLESMSFEEIFETNPFNDDETIYPFMSLDAPVNRKFTLQSIPKVHFFTIIGWLPQVL
jgi:hypothetical protein